MITLIQNVLNTYVIENISNIIIKYIPPIQKNELIQYILNSYIIKDISNIIIEFIVFKHDVSYFITFCLHPKNYISTGHINLSRARI